MSSDKIEIAALDFLAPGAGLEWPPEGGPAPWVAVMAFDPYIERLALQKLGLNSGERQVVLGAEVSPDWIDSHLVSQGLFASQEVSLVLAAEGLKNDALAHLKEARPGAVNGRAAFCFGKDGKAWKDVSSLPGVRGIRILAPKFWEYPQVAAGLARAMGVQLPPNVAAYLAGSLPNEVGRLVQALGVLRQEVPAGRPVPLDLARSLFPPERLDTFKLAHAFSRKDKKAFLSQVLALSLPVDELEDLFRFMQGHLVKLSQASALKERQRPTKYERELMEEAPKWGLGEIAEEARFFGRMQLLAKERSPDLVPQLTLRLISLS